MAYEFKATRQVQFSETDMAGLMHFSNFFRFMETAEHGFYRSLGFSVVDLSRHPRLGWPRVHAACDYKKPLRFEDMVEGLRFATSRGEWSLGVAPASAAGPDLRQLVVGSEGAFGVIPEVTVRVRERPTVSRYEGFVLDGWEAGATAVRELAQHRVLGDVTRLSDPQETDVAMALKGGWKTKLVE